MMHMLLVMLRCNHHRTLSDSSGGFTLELVKEKSLWLLRPKRPAWRQLHKTGIGIKWVTAYEWWPL